MRRAGYRLHVLKRVIVSFGFAMFGKAVFAQQPRDWQLSFQDAHSPVEQSIQGLHAFVVWLMALVTAFVALLLIYVMWRFRSTKNSVPSRMSHHTALEIAWTILPVLLLVAIAIPSFRLIYFEDRTLAADLTIKVVGHQWYWEYAYPDQGGVNFSSYAILDDKRQSEQGPRNLAVDNRLVLPVGKNVRLLTTSGDVIHSFFVPSLGIQRYAIPGRTIETWVRIDTPGIYYGQCNQICGTNHSMMPISVEALPENEFEGWVAKAKSKFALNDSLLRMRRSDPAVVKVAEATR